MHVNREYGRAGEIDPQQLVAITDITDEVAAQIENTRARIAYALDVVASNVMPDPAPERAQLRSYEEWLDIREELDPPLPEDSIHRLPSMNAEIALDLLHQGISTIDAIVDFSVLNKATRRYINARALGTRTADNEALRRFLDGIAYPVYYFDYETAQSLLPSWDGTRPYQQVPFQYSLHIPHEPGGEIEHQKYLHRDASNPMPALLRRLREDVGDIGSVVVRYAPFEKKPEYRDG